MARTAMVTGAGGFVGRHMVRRLEHDGWEVKVCDTKFGDRQDCRYWFGLDHKVDLIVHCAAVVGGRVTIDREPMKVATDLAIDSDFFQYVMRNRPWRAIYFSSSAAYPIALQNGQKYASRLLRETDIAPSRPLMPDAIYGWVKLTGEKLAAYANGEGCKVHVFRPFSGYGADQDLDYPFPSFVGRARRRDTPFEIWGPGTQTRDFIHIDDIVEAIMTVLEIEPAELGPLNLCTGQSTSFLDLARYAAKQADYEPMIRTLPEMPTGVMYRVGNPRKMNGHYWPKIDIHEGIARALAHNPR